LQVLIQTLGVTVYDIRDNTNMGASRKWDWKWRGGLCIACPEWKYEVSLYSFTTTMDGISFHRSPQELSRMKWQWIPTKLPYL
jgi:hypothetical protein